LIALEDDIKRVFYEVECIRGNWSVRELKRQIGSLYYERSALSINKQKLADLSQQGAEKAEAQLVIRDPYVFEFLGLKPREVMSESQQEEQLIDKLEEFLLELGHGFCFEATTTHTDRRRAFLCRFGIISPYPQMPCTGRTEAGKIQP